MFRREHLGFVFQSFNLLPMLTAGQNILLPLELAGRPTSTAERYQTLAADVSASPTGSATGRPSSPAASSSGWRSPAR